MLADAHEDLTAFTSFPVAHWRKLLLEHVQRTCASFFEPLFHRLLRQPSATLRWEIRRMEGQKQQRDQQQRGRDALPCPAGHPRRGRYSIQPIKLRGRLGVWRPT